MPLDYRLYTARALASARAAGVFRALLTWLEIVAVEVLDVARLWWAARRAAGVLRDPHADPADAADQLATRELLIRHYLATRRPYPTRRTSTSTRSRTS